MTDEEIIAFDAKRADYVAFARSRCAFLVEALAGIEKIMAAVRERQNTVWPGMADNPDKRHLEDDSRVEWPIHEDWIDDIKDDINLGRRTAQDYLDATGPKPKKKKS